jgi:hypothetical protein
MSHPIHEQAVGLLGDLVENLISLPGWFLDFVDARGVVMVVLGLIALGLAFFVGVRVVHGGIAALEDPLILSSAAMSFLAWFGCGVLYVVRDDEPS